MNDSNNIQHPNFNFKGTFIGFGQDQSISANQVVDIPHQKWLSL